MKKIISILLAFIILSSSLVTSIFALDVKGQFTIKAHGTVVITGPDGYYKKVDVDGSYLHTIEYEINTYEPSRIYTIKQIPESDPYIISDTSEYDFYINVYYDEDDELKYSYLLIKDKTGDSYYPDTKEGQVEFKNKYLCSIIWIDGMDPDIVYKGDDGKPIFFDKGDKEPPYPSDPTKEGFEFAGWYREVVQYWPDGTPKEIIIRAKWVVKDTYTPPWTGI